MGAFPVDAIAGLADEEFILVLSHLWRQPVADLSF